MKFVYVLEDDPKFQKEISEAIAIVDPKIQIRIFPQLDNFVKWLGQMMKVGPSAIAIGGEPQTFVKQEPVDAAEAHQLVLVISKVEFLGAEQLELLRKTRQLFIDRKICTAEDPTSFVLTAFDEPHFKARDLENRILNNLILKPFDRLILQQHLIFAIDGRHPASKFTVANQKTSAVVELLKDVEMESLSDIGIVTKSYREIPVGAVAKYYGQSFKSDRHRSLFAVCRECISHPANPEIFRCTFTFFSADHTQISNFRKKTRAKDTKAFAHDWVPKKNSGGIHVVLLDDEEHSPSGLSGFLEKTFEHVKITTYPSFPAYLADLDPSHALQQRDTNLKTLGGANTVTLHFDLTGSTYLDVESDKLDLSALFGVRLADLKTKTNWFAQALPIDHKEKFRKYIQNAQLVEDNMLSLTMNEMPFLVKVTQVSKTDKKFHITLAEPTKDEQITWLQSNSKLQIPVDLIIGNHKLFGEGAKERWGFIKEKLQARFGVTPKIFVTTKKDFTDSEERLLGEVVEDIYQKPVDRIFFLQKVKFFFPQLREKGEKIEIKSVLSEEIIKSVNPVKIDEISEAGVVMYYYRPIHLGSFREIVLWQPYEVGSPELLATCNFVEESQTEKGLFKCHFVFFGVTDSFLKHIRIWIRDNYVLSKEGQAS